MASPYWPKTPRTSTKALIVPELLPKVLHSVGRCNLKEDWILNCHVKYSAHLILACVSKVESIGGGGGVVGTNSLVLVDC